MLHKGILISSILLFFLWFVFGAYHGALSCCHRYGNNFARMGIFLIFDWFRSTRKWIQFREIGGGDVTFGDISSVIRTVFGGIWRNLARRKLKMSINYSKSRFWEKYQNSDNLWKITKRSICGTLKSHECTWFYDIMYMRNFCGTKKWVRLRARIIRYIRFPLH